MKLGNFGKCFKTEADGMGRQKKQNKINYELMIVNTA
jgi:hypothetical protein